MNSSTSAGETTAVRSQKTIHPPLNLLPSTHPESSWPRCHQAPLHCRPLPSIALMVGPSITGKQHEDRHAPAEPKKRKSTFHACILCSKSKNRCDDERPCSRCMRRGIQVHQSGSNAKSSIHWTASNFAALPPACPCMAMISFVAYAVTDCLETDLRDDPGPMRDVTCRK